MVFDYCTFLIKVPEKIFHNWYEVYASNVNLYVFLWAKSLGSTCIRVAPYIMYNRRITVLLISHSKAESSSAYRGLQLHLSPRWCVGKGIVARYKR